jgi:hypothetical protein
MSWKLDRNGVTSRTRLTASEKMLLTTFINSVDSGMPPNVVANSWVSDYRRLQDTEDQFEIRLSRTARATFSVDPTRKVVTLRQVGATQP